MTTIHLSKLTINSNNDIVNQLNKKLRVKVHQHSLEKTSAVANEKAKKTSPTTHSKYLMDDTMGKYLMGDTIGEGSFGKVLSCTHRETQHRVAIKILSKYRLSTPGKKQAIKLEIDIMKHITHPNIIEIIEAYETSETYNIVMEHFSSTSLATYVRTYRPIDEDILKNIVIQISEALTYLHDQGIAHRDLKPENVLINEQHQIKLIDLGLATFGDITEINFAGTPQYMSPELVQKRPYDPFKADIWAFGIMLYWIVLGYFPQDNPPKKSQHIQRNSNYSYNPRSNKKFKLFDLQFPKDMHPGIEYLLMKMLEEDPIERVNAKDILYHTWIRPVQLKKEIKKLTGLIAKEE